MSTYLDIYQPSDRAAPVPSREVRKNENSIINSDRSGAKNREFPMRPAYGSKGNQILLWANYAEIKISDKVLHRYTISINPDVQGKKAERVIKLFLEHPPDNSLRQGIATDFRSTLLSLSELPDLSPCTITYFAEGEEPRKTSKKYTVKLSPHKSLDLSHLKKYFASTAFSEDCPSKDEMVQALNIFLNHSSKTNEGAVTVGTGKVFKKRGAPTQDLGGGLKAVKGFYASVRLATSRVLVNVNVCHAAFYGEENLLKLAMKYWERNEDNQIVESFLKRLRVHPKHLSNKEGKSVFKVKTIFGFATVKDGKVEGKELAHPPIVPQFAAGSENVKFWWCSQGKERYISVYEYFHLHYRITLQKPDVPVINVGTTEKPTYLPLETCKVLPNQVARTKLNPDQTAKMIQFAIGGRTPAKNARDIELHGFGAVGLSSGNNNLKRLGVGFSSGRASPSLIAVDGRVLETPKVAYGKTNYAKVFNGGWNLQHVKFSTSGEEQNWACIGVETDGKAKVTSKDLQEFKSKFQIELNKNGVRHTEPTRLKKEVFKVTDKKDLDDIFKDACSRKVILLIIILPQKLASHRYGLIKQFGDIGYGVATICIDGTQTFSPPYLANVTMKFNLKMGGNNQSVDFKETSLKFDETMIVGIDVTHPPPGSGVNTPSIAGMVASVDSSLGQWPAVVRRQERQRQEMVSSLQEMLESRLKLWSAKNKTLPKNILVYRDGVSEGQFKTVLEKELPLLRAACQKVYQTSYQKEKLPKITVVIVVKRHHTRFYPTKSGDADKKSNPQPGTVVDRGVTEARNWDFFLQAHQAIQGTARPIHYFVAHDEIFQDMKRQDAVNSLEHITHGLCYTYGRATRAVSVCTPAYYADLVCDRARCYPDETISIHQNLKDSMFYI
ncbi:Piwi-domain-containing protein [Hypoxylon sp. FL0890]|nr:Piwi-domain-containing protein [Hypoxylon sp. FL0890]